MHCVTAIPREKQSFSRNSSRNSSLSWPAVEFGIQLFHSQAIVNLLKIYFHWETPKADDHKVCHFKMSKTSDSKLSSKTECVKSNILTLVNQPQVKPAVNMRL